MNQLKELEVIPDVVDHLPREVLEVHLIQVIVLSKFVF
jgi:hypothetical protein